MRKQSLQNPCGGEGAYFSVKNGDCGLVFVTMLDKAITVGTGDTFIGRFLYSLCQDEIFAKAVTEAALLATRVVKNGRGVPAAFENHT